MKKKVGMLFGKGTRMYSILRMKCPRCQEGQFFVSHTYDLKKAGEVLKECPNCGLKYSKEPGFYYGAMYVSYALAVALFVTLWTSFNLFFPATPIGMQIFIIIAATVILTPYLYALSKIIWANFFMKYDRYRKP